MLRNALVLSLLLASTPAWAAKPEDFVGVWGVTMTATYSSCKNASVGDVKSEEWNINVEQGKVSVVSVGGAGTDLKYEGEFGKDGIFELRNGSQTGVELKGNSHQLDGQRICARHPPTEPQPCAIIYKVKAVKK
jgi:hypothetical protein